MFYEYVKTKLEAGWIKVHPPTAGQDAKIRIESAGLASIAVLFLSREEKEQLATHSKYVAMRKKTVRVYS